MEVITGCHSDREGWEHVSIMPLHPYHRSAGPRGALSLLIYQLEQSEIALYLTLLWRETLFSRDISETLWRSALLEQREILNLHSSHQGKNKGWFAALVALVNYSSPCGCGCLLRFLCLHIFIGSASLMTYRPKPTAFPFFSFTYRSIPESIFL